MTDNLIFYGSSVGLGLIFSFYFWDTEKRNKALILAAILSPLLWTLILAIGKETMNLIKIFDYQQMNYRFPKNRAIFWAMPMFCSFFVFGSIWIEITRLKDK